METVSFTLKKTNKINLYILHYYITFNTEKQTTANLPENDIKFGILRKFSSHDND